MDPGEDEVAKFNRARSDANVVLKLSLYAGSCIAVTAGGMLDYFGSTVNTAADDAEIRQQFLSMIE
jgi:class 3 adenylate cyclase